MIVYKNDLDMKRRGLGQLMKVLSAHNLVKMEEKRHILGQDNRKGKEDDHEYQASSKH